MIRVDVPAERKGRVGVANDKSKAFCVRAVFNHSGREGMAVSYTHLDVYKRQELYLENNRVDPYPYIGTDLLSKYLERTF